MSNSIPASAIINVLPGVLSAGGNALQLVGLAITQNAQLPLGAPLSFTSAAAVSSYFGATSQEAIYATTYFAGDTLSTQSPALLWFYRWANAAASAYLRGANAGLSLTQLQALTGVLTLTVDGTSTTSATINLSSATSYSNAASLIQAAFTAPAFTVSYEPISGGFLFTTTATGATATITFATGTLSTALALTSATGAVLSQGSAAIAASAVMPAIVAATTNFVTFTSITLPDNSDMLAFAAWANGQNSRYAYVLWDDNAAMTVQPDTTSAFAQAVAAGYSSIIGIYDPAQGMSLAAFVMGSIAAVNTTATNGRQTLAFRNGALPAGVTNEGAATNIITDGANFMGGYATANQSFVFFYPGQIAGKFAWIDSWYCNVWLNSQFQLAILQFLISVGLMPYTAPGYHSLTASIQGVVDAGLNFGAIQPGVTLSAAEALAVNTAAGADIATIITQRGWYFLLQPASAQVRAARGSPPATFYYTDGQSLQSLQLASISIQ